MIADIVAYLGYTWWILAVAIIATFLILAEMDAVQSEMDARKGVREYARRMRKLFPGGPYVIHPGRIAIHSHQHERRGNHSLV